MNVMEITPVDDIDGIDLNGVPMCQCWLGPAESMNKQRCTRPSAFRIFSICRNCGAQSTFFICEICHNRIMWWGANCGIPNCDSRTRGITEYR